jgi:hypothetical protein
VVVVVVVVAAVVAVLPLLSLETATVVAGAAVVVVGAAIVTAIRFVVPNVVMVSVVCALPAVSVIENDAAAVKLELTVPPPSVAVDVAVMVQTVDEVCTIPVKAEMFVKVKSVPDTVDNVEHVIASLPVTVNVIVPDVEVDADAANVTVGAVVSAIVTVVDCGDEVSVV